MIDTDLAQSLASGSAFAELTSWRKIAVSGSEAVTWLNALISADIDDLGPNRARRSLLLSPTGRVRAEFTVAILPEGMTLLVQDPVQPRSILELLSPYVLSSDVALADRTDELVVLAFPGRSLAPDAPKTVHATPSCVGIGGVDLVASMEDRDAVVGSLSAAFRPADPASLEAWRVAAGIPRVGIDVAPDDLPQEAALEGAVAFAKGCFLGQEAVARVRNLGHPRRVLLHLEDLSPGAAVAPGDPVLFEGRPAGTITSATAVGDAVVALASIRWNARLGPFTTETGELLTPRPALAAERS